MGESPDGGLIWNTNAVSYPVRASEIDMRSLADDLSSGTGLKLPESDWQSDFMRGYRGKYRSVMEGPAPTAETIGRYSGEVVDSFRNFGLSATGAGSMNAAIASWKAGNYGTSALQTAQAFGEAGLTVLSLGTSSTVRKGAAVATQDLTAIQTTYIQAAAVRDRVISNIAESQAARTSSRFDIHLAREDQVRWGYAADEWGMTTLTQGTRVYGGIPGQSAYYTTEQTLANSRLSRESLFQGLQVSPHPEFGYRPKMGVYEIQNDITIPTGVVKANPLLGPGGETQYFIRNYSEQLRLIDTIKLGK